MRRLPLILALGLGPSLLSPLHAQPAPSPAAQQQFVFAYRLLQRGDAALAAQTFDDYLGQFPNDPRRGDGLYFRALLARQAGDNAAALQFLANAPEPTFVPRHAVQLLRGQAALDLGRFDLATATLAAIDPAPLDIALRATLLHLRGLAARGSGNLAAAAALLKDAAEIDNPLRARSLLELARVQSLLHSPDAPATLDRAIALGDRGVTPEAAVLAGDLASKAADFPAAIRSYRLVITQYADAPQFSDAALGLLSAHFAAQQYNDLLTQAAQLRPSLRGDPLAQTLRLAALAHQQLQQHEQAIALLQSLLQNHPGSTVQEQALYDLAVSHFERADFDAMERALATLDRLHPASTRLPDALALRAAADVRKGRPDDGLARLAAVIAQGPASPVFLAALQQRGQILESLYRIADAAADYQRHLDASFTPAAPPTDAALRVALRLAHCRLQLQQPTLAAELAQRLLDLADPPSRVRAEALYVRSLALAQAGNTAAAIDAADAVLKLPAPGAFRAPALYQRSLLRLVVGQTDAALEDLAALAADDAPDSAVLRRNALRLASLELRRRPDAPSRQHAAACLERLDQLAASAPHLANAATLTPLDRLWLADHDLHVDQPRQALAVLGPLLKSPREAPGATDRQVRARALLLTGKAMRALGDNPVAILALREAIALGDDAGLEAKLELGRTFALAGQLDDALAELSELVNAPLASVAAASLHERALLARQQSRAAARNGDAPAARAHLQESEKLLKRLVLLYPLPDLSPLPELASIELAEVLEDLGQTDAALAALRQLDAAFPQTPFAQYARAMIAGRAGQRGEAVFLLRQLREQAASLDVRLARRIEAHLKIMESRP